MVGSVQICDKLVNILFRSFTSGPPCVRIRNRKDIKPGEKFSLSKTQHNMTEYKWWP